MIVDLLVLLQQMAGLVTDYMQAYGTRFAWKCVPTRVDKLTSGLLQVTWTDTSSGQEHTDTYDSVLWAVGESQCGFNLERHCPLMDLNAMRCFIVFLAAQKSFKWLRFIKYTRSLRYFLNALSCSPLPIHGFLCIPSLKSKGDSPSRH